MDLYKPYYKLMHSLFKNAILIPDRFHIVIQIKNALDKTRINLCKKSNPNYNKLKKYWKLILKNEDDLDKDKKKYSKCFKKKVSQYDIVQYLINTDDNLKYTYNLYQGIIKSIDKRDKQKFSSIIHNVDNTKLNKYTRKAIKTLIEFLPHIKNNFENSYHKGFIEGNNNFIKVIKRIAFGFDLLEDLKLEL